MLWWCMPKTHTARKHLNKEEHGKSRGYNRRHGHQKACVDACMWCGKSACMRELQKAAHWTAATQENSTGYNVHSTKMNVCWTMDTSCRPLLAAQKMRQPMLRAVDMHQRVQAVRRGLEVIHTAEQEPCRAPTSSAVLRHKCGKPTGNHRRMWLRNNSVQASPQMTGSTQTCPLNLRQQTATQSKPPLDQGMCPLPHEI
jgi:hypothetical protein